MSAVKGPSGVDTPVRVPRSLWTNFAQIGTCSPSEHHYPTDTAQVAEVVKKIRVAGSKCRVAGGGKSPNACTFTNDHLIHMDRMDRIINIDTTARTITCQGGASMEHVLKTLDASGLMLTCVPSFVKTTVAGCIAAATHSSGIATHSLCDYVTRLVLVDGTGAKQTFERGGATARELALAACHLGALGVIVEVTLQTEDKSVWHLRSSPLSFFAAADATSMAKKIKENEYYRFWWVPHTNQCYESFGKRVNVVAPGPEREAYESWKRASASLAARGGNAVKGNWLRHGVVERALKVACTRPVLQPAINKVYARTFYGAPSEQYGSTLECFTFDCLFKQWANEWAIPISKAPEALVLLREMIEKRNLRVHFPVELRFSGADATAMSPAVGRDTCWLGVVMYRPHLNEARDTMAFYDGFNEIVQKLGGRPHWAKYFAWGDAEMSAAYGSNWEDFKALRSKLDPEDLFVNPWLANLMSSSANRVNTTVFPASGLPQKCRL